jgi:hypothetical protein
VVHERSGWNGQYYRPDATHLDCRYDYLLREPDCKRLRKPPGNTDRDGNTTTGCANHDAGYGLPEYDAGLADYWRYGFAGSILELV